MQISSELKKRLINVLDALAEGYKQHKQNESKKDIMLGVGATVLALPVAAISGLTPALSLLKFALPKLFHAHQNEKKVDALQELRDKFTPRPSFTPRPRP